MAISRKGKMPSATEIPDLTVVFPTSRLLICRRRPARPWLFQVLDRSVEAHSGRSFGPSAENSYEDDDYRESALPTDRDRPRRRTTGVLKGGGALARWHGWPVARDNGVVQHIAPRVHPVSVLPRKSIRSYPPVTKSAIFAASVAVLGFTLLSLAWIAVPNLFLSAVASCT